MKTLPYTIEQAQLLSYVEREVEKMFADNPVPAHGFDHVKRVVENVRRIVSSERVKSPFLCELSAWMHDIGRTKEKKPGSPTREHHELSYQMLRKWLRKASEFDFLTADEKKEVLYSVRYHWNDAADRYDTAWVLRDADKLDVLGKIGVQRLKELFLGNDDAYNQALRNTRALTLDLRTKTANKIFKKEKLFEPLDHAYYEFLDSKVESVEL